MKIYAVEEVEFVPTVEVSDNNPLAFKKLMQPVCVSKRILCCHYLFAEAVRLLEK